MRKTTEIEGMHEQFSEKIWYIRHLIWAAKIANGEIELDTLADRQCFETAQQTALELEEQYGKTHLRCADHEYFIRLGQLSALAWVLGADWDESFDT